MSKKETFINEIEDLLFDAHKTLSEDAQIYFDALKGQQDKERPAFTDNGILVLKYMQENKDIYNNAFKAKDMGEGIGVSSRTVSGAARKLTSDGYIEKLGENPVVYSLTEKGIAASFDA